MNWTVWNRFGSGHVTPHFARLNAALPEFAIKMDPKLAEPFFGSGTGTVRFQRVSSIRAWSWGQPGPNGTPHVVLDAEFMNIRSWISPYIYLLILLSVCPIYTFKPYKTIHFLKPLLEGVHLEKSKFDLVHFPGISGHFRLVLYIKSGLIFFWPRSFPAASLQLYSSILH